MIVLIRSNCTVIWMCLIVLKFRNYIVSIAVDAPEKWQNYTRPIMCLWYCVKSDGIPSYWLTHWGRVTHICVGKITIIVSDNGLVPEQTVEQKMRRCRFETPSRSLWRHYNCRISLHRDALCHSIINVPLISLLSTKYTKSVCVRTPSSLVGHSHIWSILEYCFNLR